jgi:pimeloyl-ACP methyl ester carboxylesterase
MGAHPALALAATQPDRVRRLVIMNCLLFGDGDTSLRIALMRRSGLNNLAFKRAPSIVYSQCKRTFLARNAHWPTELDDDFLPAFRRPRVGQFLVDLCANVEASFSSLPALYWRIDQPVLALWAEHEAHFPVTQARRFADLVGKAEVRVLDGASHWMPFTHAVDIHAAVSPFLEDAP